MTSKILRWIGPKLANLVYKHLEAAQQRALPKFGNQPKNLRIEFPSRIVNAGYVLMGDDVSLGPGCMINAIRRYPGKFMQGLPEETEIQTFSPTIRIGNRVSATGYVSITATHSVIIEDDVLLASHIFISDHSHGNDRTDIPYKYQPLTGFGEVVVGAGSWIGEHAVIMPGVRIGANAIIGANSVVTRDVPARAIVAGAPARVIRQWSDERSEWTRP